MKPLPKPALFALLLAGLALAVVVGLGLGSGAGFDTASSGDATDLGVVAMLRALVWQLTGAGPAPDRTQLLILLGYRLPEVVLAAAVGASLALSGGIFQVTLRNPLADPLLLGVASGASLAASVAIGLGASSGMVPAIAATAGAGATLAFVFAIAGRRGRFDPGTMVLAGVVASAFYSAITLFLLAVTPSQTTSQILQWTMGGFADAGFAKARWAVPTLAALGLAGMAGARPLNLLAMGDDAARSSGLAVAPARAILYAIGAALTGVSVAASGVVGFVGLVVPHTARFVAGPDSRASMPATALIGAAACVLADSLARVAVPASQAAWAHLHGVPAHTAPAELPVGVITALVGAPFFIALLVKRRDRGIS